MTNGAHPAVDELEQTAQLQVQAPRYLQLERKEARLRPDQVEDLATVRRRLTRLRSGASERITDNTLIRIAVDLLLEQSAYLHGSSEEELRKSVSSEVRS